MRKESSKPDFIEMERAILRFWQDNKCFDKLVQKNRGHEMFRFLDGPATANNRLGVHHFWGRTLKDLTIRYNALKGRDCQYQNGFDAQGLWVEVNVEKELGLNGKPEILEYGLDNFTTKCMDRVKYFASEMTRQSIRMGQCMDWENSYFTNTDENILSIWHFLKKCDEEGYLVKRNRPMAWCPRCGTSLSEHEMSSSYHDVTHTAIFVKFPVIDRDFKMLAWTTTPWTLSANTALAVNPELDYVKVHLKESGDNIVLGEDALKVVKEEYEVIDRFKGKDLVGLTYETCFPELEPQKFTHPVLPWSDVDAVEGSCIVHIAPGCGAEDFELVNSLKGEYDLPEFCPIDEQGVMLQNTGFLAGKKTSEVVDLVVDRLKSDGKLYYAHPYTHSYPYCWRCKTDLVYKLIPAWYISMDNLRPRLISAVDEVSFYPEYGRKRMLDWLSNMGDWNISRNRFYGLPLPFYVCEKCGHIHVVGSMEELSTLAVNPQDIASIPNLHRPYIDKIKIKCPKCSSEVARVSEVGDCWLDAGITPFSTKRYFTDKEYFDKNFPSEYVCEMVEQIKLWFYSMLVMSVVLTGHAPYQNIVTNQYVKDENGGEFHKSGGNTLDADIVADKVGADTIRYLYASAPLTSDVRFGYSLTDEARRKLMNFWNAYIFYNTYATIDHPDVASVKLNPDKLCPMDRWLYEKVNKFIENSDKNYAEYNNYLIVRDFENLVDELTNFYIRSNRKRFWKSDDKEDQLLAYASLYRALKCMVQVMTPIIPFLCEHIWQNLVRPTEEGSAECVMLSGFPKVEDNFGYSSIIDDATLSRDIMTLALRLRNEHSLKIKQPLRTLYVLGDDRVRRAIETFEDIIRDELNVKNIVLEDNVDKFNIPYLSVNFKSAGAVLKGEVQKLKEHILSLSDDEMRCLVEQYRGGSVSIEPFGELSSDLFFLNLKSKEEFVISTENNVTVVLDTTLDEALIKEGLYRELVRTAQVLRKESGFNIEDRIAMDIISSSPIIKEVVSLFEDNIKTEVLVRNFNQGIVSADIEKEVQVGDENVIIKLARLQ